MYVRESPPGTYDHRGLECPHHGNGPHFRVYKSAEPFECVACSLGEKRKDEASLPNRQVTFQPPPIATKQQTQNEIVEALFPKEVSSFVRTERGVGRFVYASPYSDTEFSAEIATPIPGVTIAIVKTKLSQSAGMLMLAAKEILGSRNVQILFGESDVVMYKRIG